MKPTIVLWLTIVLLLGCPKSNDDTGGDDDDDNDVADDDTGDDDDVQPEVAGDLDGDGIPENVLSDPGANTRGTVWILAAQDPEATTLDLGAAITVLESTDGFFFGTASTVCDLDGDKHNDLLVSNLDEVLVWWDGPTEGGWSDPDLVISHSGLSGLADAREMGCADLTGDGTADLAVHGWAGEEHGVYILPGSADLASTDDVDLASWSDAIVLAAEAEHGDMMGDMLELADVDGDEVFDVIASTWSWTNDGGQQMGSTFIFYGGPGLSSKTSDDADLQLLPPVPQTGFGTHLAAGDMNGDGMAEVMVGGFLDYIAIYSGNTLASATGTAQPDYEPDLDMVFGGLTALHSVGREDVEAEALLVAMSAPNGDHAIWVLGHFDPPTVYMDVTETCVSQGEGHSFMGYAAVQITTTQGFPRRVLYGAPHSEDPDKPLYDPNIQPENCASYDGYQTIHPGQSGTPITVTITNPTNEAVDIDDASVIFSTPQA